MTATNRPPPPDAPPERPRLALAAGLLGFALLVQAVGIAVRVDRLVGGGGKDFLDHYLQTRAASEGLGPYRSEAVQQAYRLHVERTGEPTDIPGGGFYYPPALMLVARPFAAMPWRAAWPAWQALLIAACVGCGSLARTFGRPPGDHRLAAAVIVAATLLDPLTTTVLAIGQTALLLCLAVALGESFYERGWRLAGALAWGLVSIKPHFGLPLFALAGVLGGRRRLVEVGLAIVAINLLGCLVTAGTPTILLDYPGHLASSHLDVGYNRVTNDQVVSWNRLVYALTGREIELTMGTMALGYLAFALLVGARVAVEGRGVRPSPAYALAAAAVAPLLCAQAKGYDLMLLILLAPLLLRRLDEGRRFDVALVLGLFVVASIPRGSMVRLGGLLGLGDHALGLFLSYRALVLAAIAAYLLVRGDPSGPRAEPTPTPEPEPG